MSVKLTWPIVTVIGIFVAGVVVMAALKVDYAALLSLGMLIMGGLGFGIAQNNQIKDQTNGNNTQLLEGLKEFARVLAVSQPVHPDVVAAITESSNAPRPVSAPPFGVPVSPASEPAESLTDPTALLPIYGERKGLG